MIDATVLQAAQARSMDEFFFPLVTPDTSVVGMAWVKGADLETARTELQQRFGRFQLQSNEQCYRWCVEMAEVLAGLDIKFGFGVVALFPHRMTCCVVNAEIYLRRANKFGGVIKDHTDQLVKVKEGTRLVGDVVGIVVGPTDVSPMVESWVHPYRDDAALLDIVKKSWSDSGNASWGVLVGVSVFAKPTAPPAAAASSLQSPLSALMEAQASAFEQSSARESMVDPAQDTLPFGNDPAMAVFQPSPIAPIESLTPAETTAPIQQFFDRLGSSLQPLRMRAQEILASWPTVLKRFLPPSAPAEEGAVPTIVSRSQYIKRLVQGMIALFLIIGAIGGVWWWQRSVQQQQLAIIDSELAPLRVTFTQLQQGTTSDPLTVRDQTAVLKAQLEQLAATRSARVQKERIQEFLAEVLVLSEAVSGKESLPKLDIFYDLRGHQSDFVGSRMVYGDRSLVVADGGKRQLVAIDTENRQLSALTVGELSSLRDITLENRVVTLLGDGQIFQWRLGSAEAAQQLSNGGNELNESSLIRSFNSNLYVLNIPSANIYRFAVENNALSAATGWLRSLGEFAMSDVQSMAIDGEIWFGTRSGRVFRFSSGRPMSFQLDAVEPATNSPLIVYTQPGFDNLYVLEPAQERLLIFTKSNGRFLKEIKSSSLQSASQVVVDSTEQRAFFLSGSLVYVTGL
jgi:hypothetical protein